MKKYLVIGNPINHSLSPKLHNHWIKKNKINAVYDKKQINENDIKSVISEVRNGKIEGIIDPNKSNEIEVKFIKKKNNASYSVYKITDGRLYTDRVNDTAIIKNNKVVKDASFQFRDKKIKVVNVSAEENIVFEKGTQRIKRKINNCF